MDQTLVSASTRVEWLRQSKLQLKVLFNLARAADPLRDWPPPDVLMPRWRSLKAAVISRQLRKVSPGEGANKDTLVALTDLETFVLQFAGDEWGWLREFSNEWRSVHGDEAKPRAPTARAESETKRWLIDLMKRGDPEVTKKHYYAEAKREFGVSERGFVHAWKSAVRESGNSIWSRPGRKRAGGKS